MKKRFLLFTALCFSTMSLLAQGQFQAVKIAPKQVAHDKYVPSAAPVQTSNNLKRGVGDPFPSTIGTKFVIGKTTYDLQSNGALQNRLMVTGTNNIHAAWTMSQETGVTSTSPYADRGTGYAFHNGTAWGAAPSARIEGTTARTGFGAMAVNGSGNVVYVAHSSTFDIILNEKTPAGWTSTVTPLNTSPKEAIWPDVATSSDWMYVICGSADSNTVTNGIRYGFFFSRSNDNGQTWMDNAIPMPLIDSLGHERGGGNSYSISARDSIVVIAFGDYGTDLTLLKSTDFGSTWTKKVVYDWPIDQYVLGDITDFDADNITDTLYALDGGFDIALDKNGNSHIAFSAYQMWNDGVDGFYRPLTSSMYYYNEIVDSIRQVDAIFADYHRACDGDSTTFQNPVAYTRTNPASKHAQYNTGSFMTQPQVSVNDGNNDVFITYSSIVDGDQTIIDLQNPLWFGISGIEGQPYRDVMVLASNDNGASFGYPVNVTRSRHYEEAFPSVPEVITGTDFHILYQGDIEPGTIMSNEDDYDSQFENYMIYQKVSIAEIFTESASFNAPCGQMEIPLSVSNVEQTFNGTVNIYPNPAVDFVSVELTLDKSADDVSYELFDLTGRLISKVSHSNVINDNVQISVEGLSSGNYILKVTADNALSSHKVSVK